MILLGITHYNLIGTNVTLMYCNVLCYCIIGLPGDIPEYVPAPRGDPGFEGLPGMRGPPGTNGFKGIYFALIMLISHNISMLNMFLVYFVFAWVNNMYIYYRPIVGEKGDFGMDGLPGLIGIRGDKGHAGTTGLRGKDGRVGEMGGTGLPGERGIPGLDGFDGLRGEPGETGAIGLRVSKQRPHINPPIIQGL